MPRRNFSVDWSAEAAGVTRRQMLGALRRRRDDLVGALVSLGVDRAAAGGIADVARLLGPDEQTRPSAGDRARRRTYRREYERRRAARPTASAREAAGHAPAGSTGPTATFAAVPVAGGNPRLLIAAEVSRADIHRAARYDSLVHQLAAGRMTGAQFQRRVSRWQPVTVIGPPSEAGRYRFVSDPRTALALAQVALDEGITEWIDSGRARPLPRRRSIRARGRR